ncbi:PREDICTED: uncharacterized protein LOC109127977 [Camelina sativa]|uniref:Uncharacterized protein LOC109127977 n=1 Tax=Camelina sativa TaxID=90675 RepID=A0ABM1QQY2_CAMSA|nr:PREDICTED: uncharacterized protein LOC109127977 [Camelina sativa]
MLGKQVWRIIQAPQSLLSRFLKARYYSDSNIFNAGSGNKPSFIWKSLLEGRELIKKGMRVLLGNGQTTNIWYDPWLITTPPRPPRRRDNINTDLTTVNELFLEGLPHRWNVNLLQELFIDEDVQQIIQIKLSPSEHPDLLGWHYNDSGLYTVKSGNTLVFQDKQGTWQEDLSLAVADAKEWTECWSEEIERQRTNQANRNRRLNRSQWRKPPRGMIKCNYDGTFIQPDTEGQSGWIARDETGFFLSAGQNRRPPVGSALEAELQSLIAAMQQMWIKGYRRVIFEGDNQKVKDLASGTSRNYRVHNYIREILYWQKKFHEVQFQWTRRNNNKAAYRLAKEQLENHVIFISHFYVPTCIVNILHEDHSAN